MYDWNAVDSFRPMHIVEKLFQQEQEMHIYCKLASALQAFSAWGEEWEMEWW